MFLRQALIEIEKIGNKSTASAENKTTDRILFLPLICFSPSGRSAVFLSKSILRQTNFDCSALSFTAPMKSAVTLSFSRLRIKQFYSNTASAGRSRSPCVNMNTGRQGAACCELRKRGFHRDNSVPTGVMPKKRAERRYLMNTSVTKC